MTTYNWRKIPKVTGNSQLPSRSVTDLHLENYKHEKKKKQKKNHFVFNFSNTKSNREVVSKVGELAYFFKNDREIGKGFENWRLTES